MRSRIRYRACYAAIVLAALPTGCRMNSGPFDKPASTALAAAVASGDQAEIKRQLQQTDVDTRGSNGATLLLEAIRNGKLASAQALLDGGADPNLADQDGQTSVHAAAFAVDPAFLQLVLAHGGDPNVRNPVTGAPPLTAAILGLHQSQVQLLLDAKADPDLADNNRDAPIHNAARTNSGAILLQLLQAGANPLARNSSGATFQDYYFGFPRNVLSAAALDERRQLVTWLKTHQIPLQAAVDASY